MKWSYIIKLQSVENGNGCVPINMFKFLCGNSGAYSCATKRANEAHSNTRTQNVYAVVHFDAFDSLYGSMFFIPNGWVRTCHINRCVFGAYRCIVGAYRRSGQHTWNRHKPAPQIKAEIFKCATKRANNAYGLFQINIWKR